MPHTPTCRHFLPPSLLGAWVLLLSAAAFSDLAAQSFESRILYQPVRIPLGGEPFAFDVDGDGLDEAGLTDSRSMVFVRNLGDGRFSEIAEPIPYPGPGNFQFATAADFDGDGDEDIALIEGFTQTRPWILENRGADGFHPIGMDALEHFNHYRWHDLNGDGAIDMLCLSGAPGTSRRLRTFLNDGTNRFTPSQTLPGETDAFVVFDIDNDAADDDDDDGSARALDIVAFDVLPVAIRDDDDDDSDLEEFRRSESRPTVFANDGAGTFSESRVAAPFTALSMNSKIRETGDGLLHFVEIVAGEAFSRVFDKGRLLRKTEQVLNDTWQSFSNGDRFTIGDFDGDGDIDLVTPTDRHTSEPGVLHLNDGNDRFVATASPLPIAGATTGEFDGQPGDDLLVTEFFRFEGFNATALRTIRLTDADAVVTEIPMSSQNLGGWLVDGDDDGDVDLVVASRDQKGNRSVQLALTDGEVLGAAGFTEIAQNVDITAWRVQDFDGDGDDDLASIQSWHPMVLQNNGAGAFTRKTLSAPGPWPFMSGLVYDDFDGDGRTDIAGKHAGFESVSSWSQNEDGRFSPIQALTERGSFIYSGTPASGDIDGDGAPDVVSLFHPSESSRPQLVWYENEAGAFSKRHLIDETFRGYSVTTSCQDLDGDGDIDLAVSVNSNPGQPGGLVTYRNDGAGDFSPWQDFSSIETPSATHIIIDLENDGVMEIVTATGEAQYLEKEGEIRLLRQENGHFHPTEWWQAGVPPAELQTGDLDGDGRTDFVVVDDTGVRWFRNSTGDAPPIKTTVRVADSTVSIHWDNVPEGQYHIERSTDLSVWQSRAQRAPSATGVLEFDEELTPDGDHPIFYRLRPAE